MHKRLKKIITVAIYVFLALAIILTVVLYIKYMNDLKTIKSNISMIDTLDKNLEEKGIKFTKTKEVVDVPGADELYLYITESPKVSIYVYTYEKSSLELTFALQLNKLVKSDGTELKAQFNSRGAMVYKKSNKTNSKFASVFSKL